ncbi:hypothetical protein HQN60_11875 [Deefgea piscis]|uniref:Bacteriophage N4 adsorption protein A C-terminal domain-containing protein n=1 Tax=Deefgea piscis TaxID=2739061 RepID=A0A6M8SRP7_9NEIS|nr:hypothetical protein [Deefgea piscis]QKJ67341.1 hypothetical protein HQN60_11875 [Deefgea piscis]
MAEANWLGDEWREFRSYPRMEKAYQRLDKGDYVGARQLLEEVYKIDPNRRKGTLSLADVCARQKDMQCLDRLSKDWLRRAPNDGMGYLLQAWHAYLKQDDVMVMRGAAEALKRPNLSAFSRNKAAEAWLNAALRQGNVSQIQQTLARLAQYRIPVSRALLAQAEAVLQSAKSNPTYSAQLVPSAIPAMTAAMKPKVTQQTAQPSQPAARAPVAPEVFPYTALSAAQREQKITNDFSALIAKQQYKTLQLQLSQLRQAHLFTPALAEVVSNLLQEKNCPLLIKETPVSDLPSQTTERAQMAAAYCSKRNYAQAAAYFAAANRLSEQKGHSSIPAMQGEGEALLASGDFAQGMHRLDQRLQLEMNEAQARELAKIALQHLDLAVSADIAAHYPDYFPPGELALEHARQARQQADFEAADAAYQQALAAKPTALLWYEYAGFLQQLQRHEQQGAALAKAAQLAPNNPQILAEYGFWLKGQGQTEQALALFRAALAQDANRKELSPEIAQLEMALGQTELAIADLRLSIDHQAEIQTRLRLDNAAMQTQLFGWQRNVQTLEDRWSWSLGGQIRLNQGPDGQLISSPVQFAQYGGSLNAEVAYRLDPLLDAARPTMLFARTDTSLQDQSIALLNDNANFGIGIRQRLLSDYVLVGSAEWIYRQGAPYSQDMMLRLSGSHSINTDWQPVKSQWTSLTVYGDAAGLVRANSYYLTALAEIGEHYRLSDAGKTTLMPYINSMAAMNTDNEQHATVSRFDIGVGLALVSWLGGDPWRAPDLQQRISFEVRQVIGGNSDDRFAVLFHWRVLH